MLPREKLSSFSVVAVMEGFLLFFMQTHLFAVRSEADQCLI